MFLLYFCQELIGIIFKDNLSIYLAVKNDFTCPKNSIMCTKSRMCIHISNLCDGFIHCPHGDDEENCELPILYFKCNATHQISYKRICNNINDCDNRIDEINCEFDTCAKNEFRCASGNCITNDYQCDNFRDCSDGSDENCVVSPGECLAPKEQFQCDDKCIFLHNMCDSVEHCNDGTDENQLLCLKKRGLGFVQLQIDAYTCHVTYDKYNQLYTKVQFPYYKLKNCQEQQCAKGQYQCEENRYCIDISEVCDNISHCYYHDDEIGCENFYPAGFFICPNKKLLPIEYLCDDNLDCSDDSDERLCEDKPICPQHCECNPFYVVVCYHSLLVDNSKDVFIENINSQKFKRLHFSNVNIYYLNQTRNIHVNAMDFFNTIWKQYFDISYLFPNIALLVLEKSRISDLGQIFRRHMKMLQHLNLRDNPIQNVEKFSFEIFPQLRFVDLSETKIVSIHQNLFKGLKHLEIIYMMKLKIRWISPKASVDLIGLQQLHWNDSIIKENQIIHVMKNLKNVEYVYSNYYVTCCFVWKYSNSFRKCLPDKSTISSCSNLIASINLRVAIWVIGVLCITLNMLSLLFRLIINKKKINAYFICLCLSDVCSGIYLVSIGIVDRYYSGNFMEYNYNWIYGNVCKLIGSVFSGSLILSSTLLLSITLERYHAISNPINHLTKTQIRLSIGIPFLLTFILMTIPISIYQVSFTAEQVFGNDY
ncbi:DgyrCDS9719 [Dimorphilus gyrociliatus]|uniref:DgyrCDS9719 n=1 Tax=Dimorphilus gyrociliatus TaxID=2664684 RepID=A0A7I8VXU5_9ANNE|nr:DgyrCDS9719 [Dimorphilus gyrociliatus]